MIGFETEEVSYEVYWLKCAFPKARINEYMEVIVEPKANEYFLAADCYTKEEIQAKVLEWLSRGACKTEPYQSKRKNQEFREYMQNGINEYLGMDFTQEDFEKIYQYIGNRVDHSKTIKFIKSSFDMNVLGNEVEE